MLAKFAATRLTVKGLGVCSTPRPPFRPPSDRQNPDFWNPVNIVVAVAPDGSVGVIPARM